MYNPQNIIFEYIKIITNDNNVYTVILSITMSHDQQVELQTDVLKEVLQQQIQNKYGQDVLITSVCIESLDPTIQDSKDKCAPWHKCWIIWMVIAICAIVLILVSVCGLCIYCYRRHRTRMEHKHEADTQQNDEDEPRFCDLQSNTNTSTLAPADAKIQSHLNHTIELEALNTNSVSFGNLTYSNLSLVASVNNCGLSSAPTSNENQLYSPGSQMDSPLPDDSPRIAEPGSGNVSAQSESDEMYEGCPDDIVTSGNTRTRGGPDEQDENEMYDSGWIAVLPLVAPMLMYLYLIVNHKILVHLHPFVVFALHVSFESCCDSSKCKVHIQILQW